MNAIADMDVGFKLTLLIQLDALKSITLQILPDFLGIRFNFQLKQKSQYYGMVNIANQDLPIGSLLTQHNALESAVLDNQQNQILILNFRIVVRLMVKILADIFLIQQSYFNCHVNAGIKDKVIVLYHLNQK